MILRSLVTVALVLCAGISSFAQPGLIDNTFNPTDGGFGKGDGASGIVRSAALLPDGKMIVAGAESFNSGTSVSVARINADGSIDPTFNAVRALTIFFPSHCNRTVRSSSAETLQRWAAPHATGLPG